MSQPDIVSELDTQAATQTSLSSSTQSQPSQQSQQSRLRWTVAMETAFLEFLKQEVALGKRADNSFKKSTWEGAIIAVKGVMSGHTGPALTADKIQHKWEHLKKDYAAFVHMKNTSGMGWNEATQCPTCSDEVWDAYVKSHKDAIKFRRKGLRNYEELAELLEGRQATGEFTSNPTSSRTTMSSNSASDTATPTSTDSSGTSTPTPSGSQSIPLKRSHSSHGKRSEKVSSAQILASLKEATIARKTGIRTQAQMKLAKEFPNLSLAEKLAALEIFENGIKAEIFVGIIDDVECATEWLKRELRKMGIDNPLAEIEWEESERE